MNLCYSLCTKKFGMLNNFAKIFWILYLIYIGISGICANFLDVVYSDVNFGENLFVTVLFIMLTEEMMN